MSQPYRSIGSTIESKSLSLQSNGKLWSLDHDRIKYITSLVIPLTIITFVFFSLLPKFQFLGNIRHLTFL